MSRASTSGLPLWSLPQTDGVIDPEKAARARTRQQQLYKLFLEYDAAHPQVWDLFERRALHVFASGARNYSSNLILNWMRWHTEQAAGSGDFQFKVNNNFAPFYGRKFMQRHPELATFLRIRKQTSEDAPAVDLPELAPIDFDGPREK